MNAAKVNSPSESGSEERGGVSRIPVNSPVFHTHLPPPTRFISPGKLP